MSGKQIVLWKLLDTSAVTTALGGRYVWAVDAPKTNTSKKYIIVSGPGRTDRQLLAADADYPRSRVRVECIGPDRLTAPRIKQAAFDALKNFGGTVTDGNSPPSFSAVASIMSASFHSDGYSDARQAYVEIFDVYVDWHSA